MSFLSNSNDNDNDNDNNKGDKQYPSYQEIQMSLSAAAAYLPLSETHLLRVCLQFAAAVEKESFASIAACDSKLSSYAGGHVAASVGDTTAYDFELSLEGKSIALEDL